MLLSHIHVRCVAAGVGLREIEAHLDKRSLKVCTAHCLSLYECILSSHIHSPLTVLSHSYSPVTLILTQVTRRPGNAKAWRSENAAQVRLPVCLSAYHALSAPTPLLHPDPNPIIFFLSSLTYTHSTAAWQFSNLNGIHPHPMLFLIGIWSDPQSRYYFNFNLKKAAIIDCRTNRESEPLELIWITC